MAAATRPARPREKTSRRRSVEWTGSGNGAITNSCLQTAIDLGLDKSTRLAESRLAVDAVA